MFSKVQGEKATGEGQYSISFHIGPTFAWTACSGPQGVFHEVSAGRTLVPVKNTGNTSNHLYVCYYNY